MGSSILDSLSEAGRHDPCHPVSGPLPSHVQGRCGSCWNATQVLFLCKGSAQTVRLRENFRACLFNNLKQPMEQLRTRADSIRESTTALKCVRIRPLYVQQCFARTTRP